MRFIFTILFACTQLFAATRMYRGQIDFLANNVTTVYELVTTVSKEVKGWDCSTNHGGTDFLISVTGTETDCSDANDDVLMGGNGSATFGENDNHPIGRAICVKTTSGTAATDFINCKAYWNGQAP